MNFPPASVLVIESHPLMRAALCAAIVAEPGLLVIEPAANAAEVLQMVILIKPDVILLASRPDIILLSLGNPGLDEMEALAILQATLPGIPILALISDEVPGQEHAALQAGAQAVLTKSAPRSELICKLRELRTQAILNHPEDNLTDGGNEKSYS